MKHGRAKYGKQISVFGLVVMVILFSFPTALAGEVRGDDVIHIRSDEVIDDDLIVSGREIIVDGIVKGDLVAAGQAVTINGTVEGDLMAGAQTVTINGEVDDDLRVGAMAILIDGVIGDDVMAGGFSLESGPESLIGGDLFVGGFQALIDGELAGDINGGAGGIKISGNIGGDINVDVDENSSNPSPVSFMENIPNIPPMPAVPLGLTIDADASVAGNLTYRSPARGDVQEAAVTGEVAFIQQGASTMGRK